MVLGLMALAIFAVFAVVGGVIVWLIVSKESQSSSDDLPPRGVPWDSPENRE